MSVRTLFARNPAAAALRLLGAVVLLRLFDVFVLRSDEILGEQVLTKLGGLLLLVIYLRAAGRPWRAIGFHADHVPRLLLAGGLAMAAALAAGYLAEYAVLALQGRQPYVYWRPEGHGLLAEFGMQGGLGFGLWLLLGNALNSTAEEGLFRGLLLSHLGSRLPPLAANMGQALLFGLWHVVWPLRDALDGRMSPGTAFGMATGYMVVSGLIGFIFGLVYQRTNSLWWPWTAHTLNNSAHNLLHVGVASGVAATLGLRVLVATLCLGLLALLWLRTAGARRLPGMEPWVAAWWPADAPTHSGRWMR